MKILFDEYSSTLLQALVCVGVLCFFIGTFLSNVLSSNNRLLQNEISLVYLGNEYTATSIEKFEVKDSLIKVNEEFDYTKYVSAYNSLGDDISSYVTLSNNPDTSEVGTKKLTYLLRYNGQTLAIDSKLEVVDEKQEVRS